MWGVPGATLVPKEEQRLSQTIHTEIIRIKTIHLLHSQLLHPWKKFTNLRPKENVKITGSHHNIKLVKHLIYQQAANNTMMSMVSEMRHRLRREDNCTNIFIPLVRRLAQGWCMLRHIPLSTTSWSSPSCSLSLVCAAGLVVSGVDVAGLSSVPGMLSSVLAINCNRYRLV